ARTGVQAVLECPVEQAVDVHAAAHAPVWTVGVRMPVAVALGLTPAKACDRDHRLPWPLGATSEQNLQNTSRRWHRAKHTGWHTSLLDDGTIRWTSPATASTTAAQAHAPTGDPGRHHPAAHQRRRLAALLWSTDANSPQE
ncbi:MAG: hypothetical protein M4D85_07285, partial [Actinomycetota bacterium]|nr:hypothetical protein [Actinomycetota bacterium]